MTYALTVKLVPNPLHGQNLRKVLPRSQWDKIRKPVIEAQRGVCAVCNRPTDKLSGHEEWNYDTSQTPAVAKLTGITATCGDCHRVEHFINTIALVSEGTLRREVLEETIAHFCRVNGVDEAAFKAHMDEAAARHESLSVLEWRIDWGEFAGQIEALERKKARA